MSLGVVITTYNRPEKLKRCLEHIESQTQLPDEVVIVDDGSEADYADIKSQFSDSRFKWLTIPNQGVSAARNHGIAQATADYICLCDDDDYFCPDHITKFSNAIQSLSQPSILFSHFYELRGDTLQEEHIHPKPHQLTWQEHLVSQGMMVVCCTCMPRAAFTEFPFPKGVQYAEDHEQRLLAMSQYPVVEIQSHTAVIDRTDESATNRPVKSIARTYRNRFHQIFSNPLIRSHVRRSIRERQIYRWTSLELHEAIQKKTVGIHDIASGIGRIRSISNARSMLFVLRSWLSSRSPSH